MARRIDTPNRAVNLWGAGKDGFRAGNKAALINATENSSAFMNTIQEELAGIVESVGLTLDPANNAQVLLAIQKLIEARTGNFSIDTGVANAYVIALSPAIAAYTGNFAFSFAAVNANTGACTINAGGGVVPLLTGVGGVLASGDIQVGAIVSGIYELADNRCYITSLVQSQGDARYALLTAAAIAQDFRLTLTSGLPVTTADVTAATTLYCTPYRGNRIGLWDGAKFVNYLTAEFSLALAALTAAKPYDIFCYANAGVPTLEFLAWTNDTTRATALAYQSGILVKSGDSTRRYLGTFYTTAATTTEDSQANRYLWNYYNRVSRSMRRTETTASWTYTTLTWRQMNGSTANQLNFIVGVSEDEISAIVTATSSNSGVGVNMMIGIALDSITVPTRNTQVTSVSSGISGSANANDSYAPIAGRHFISCLEQSVATGITTWYGSAVSINSGLSGRIMA